MHLPRSTRSSISHWSNCSPPPPQRMQCAHSFHNWIGEGGEGSWIARDTATTPKLLGLFPDYVSWHSDLFTDLTDLGVRQASSRPNSIRQFPHERATSGLTSAEGLTLLRVLLVYTSPSILAGCICLPHFCYNTTTSMATGTHIPHTWRCELTKLALIHKPSQPLWGSSCSITICSKVQSYGPTHPSWFLI